MKTKMLVLLLVFATTFLSCKKDDNNNPANITVATVNSTVVSGNWRITYFWDTDHDETAHFTGYNFTFTSGGIITAVNGAITVTGSWTTGTDNSTVKFIIDFATPPDFEDLNEDWHVIERTDSRIKLQHVSGGNGGTDYLTFEKN